MRSFEAENKHRLIEFAWLWVAAATAAAVALACFLADIHVRIALIGGSVVAVCFALSGNIRLGLLWATILTAPIALCKRFLILPNMGGASALQIDATDVFLFPLAFLILREMHLGIRRPSSMVFPSPGRWWVALMIAGLVSLALGPFRTVTGLELVRMGKLLLLMWVIANEVKRRRQFRHVCVALMLSLILQSSLAITQYILQRPLGLESVGEAGKEEVDQVSKGTLQTKEFVFRVSGILGHANLLAIFLAALLPLALGIMFTRAPVGLRVLCAVGLGLGAFALVLTLSRTGWLAGAITLIGIMVLTLFHPRLRVQFPLGRAAFVVGAVAIGVGFSGKIGARLFKSDEGAVDFRWEFLEVARIMGLSSPVFGKGLNSFVFHMPYYSKYESPEVVTEKFGKAWPVVHNVYALYWAELGAVGLVIFLGFCVSMLALGIRCLRSADEEAYVLGASAFLAFIAFLVDWVASFTLRNDNMGRVLFVLIGLLGAVDRWRRVAPLRSSPPAGATRLSQEQPSAVATAPAG